MCKGAYVPYFKISSPIFCCSLFSISKMVNEHTVNYHSRPWELTSRIQPLICLWTPKGFISPEYLLNFFHKPVYPAIVPPWSPGPSTKGRPGGYAPPPVPFSHTHTHTFSEIVLRQIFFPGKLFLCHSPRHSKPFGQGTPRSWSGDWKIFKFMVLRLLEHTFVSQKTEPFHFCLFPQLSPRQKEITHFTRTAFSGDLFFPRQRRGRIIELKKWSKLNLRGYWSQVLINSTFFATCTFLVSILLCHNLDSSMLKC